MKPITIELRKWGPYILSVDWDCGFPSENILSKVNMPYVPSQSRILCYDPEVSEMTLAITRAWKMLPSLEKKCVYGKYAWTSHIKEDGQIVTAKEGAFIVGVKWDRFQSTWPRGAHKISVKVGL